MMEGSLPLLVLRRYLGEDEICDSHMTDSLNDSYANQCGSN